MDDYSTAEDLGNVTTKTETGLTCNNSYTRYVWAYNACSGLSATLTQTTLACMNVPCPNIPTFVYEGKTYNTVQIGTQCWLKENLNVGTRINGSETQTNNGIKEKYCYADLESNCDIYGGLYQWDEAMQYTTTPGLQGICPAGWHLPTDVEWTTLTIFLGGESAAGGKLKSTGTIEVGTGLWYSPNTGATNESGFTVVPAGNRVANGTSVNIGYNDYLWSSTTTPSVFAWLRTIYFDESSLGRANGLKKYGLSVRCLKD